MRATVPRTLTCLTSPLLQTWEPISHTSSGSLSPLAAVFWSTWLGSSHVCRQWREGLASVCFCVFLCEMCVCVCGEPCLRESPIVPDVAMVGEAVVHEANLALLHILFDWVQRLLFVDLRSQAVSVQTSS